MSRIEDLLKKAAEFDDPREIDEFMGSFKELYKVDFFKTGLDVILSQIEIGYVTFKIVRDIAGENLHGCCLTTEKHVFSKMFNSFVKKQKHLIRIKSLTVDTLMHEMAHALEKISRQDLSKEFEAIFKNDLKLLEGASLMSREAIKQVIFKEIELYDPSQHNSEFFARFYQLYAMSKEVGTYDKQFHFKMEDIKHVFPGTTAWVEQRFNEAIKPALNPEISKLTKKIEYDELLGGYSRKNRSTRTEPGGKKKWGGKVGSLFGDDIEGNDKIGSNSGDNVKRIGSIFDDDKKD
jgi:hypothetical protein